MVRTIDVQGISDRVQGANFRCPSPAVSRPCFNLIVVAENEVPVDLLLSEIVNADFCGRVSLQVNVVKNSDSERHVTEYRA
jgi:hypothetical protein